MCEIEAKLLRNRKEILVTEIGVFETETFLDVTEIQAQFDKEIESNKPDYTAIKSLCTSLITDLAKMKESLSKKRDALESNLGM